MAKWGEGDPRWIVEERPDATNVNNWHWTEKNASVWSKEKIGSLLTSLTLQVPDFGAITFSEVECNGEATANNRKGKLIFFYEWVVTSKWKGIVTADKDECNGSIEIPNLSEENEAHEIDVNVSLKEGEDKSDNALRFKEYIRIEGIKEIHKVVEKYLESLRKEYSADLILPTKGASINNTTVKSTTVMNTKTSNSTIHAATKHIQNLDIAGTKIETTTLNTKQNFKCTVHELFNAFTIREMVCAFTKNNVKMEVTKGGKFELFGGSVSGEFVEIVPDKQLVQKWRFRTWPSGHYSTVTLDFIDKSDSTDLKLTQTGVPANDIDRTKQGWQNYYWESMMRTFGFGVSLF